MRWFNHKLTAFSVTYAISGNLIISLASAATSVIPDLMEIGMGRFIFSAHRGISHNPIFWAPVLILFCAVLQAMMPPLPEALSIFPPMVLYGACAGVFLHLFTDLLSTGGIPLYGKKRLALHTYRTFYLSEYGVAAAIICLSSIVIYFRKAL